MGLNICDNINIKKNEDGNGYEKEKRKTEIEEGYQNSSFDSNSRSLGNASWTRSKIRDNAIRIGREAGKRRNLSRSSFGGEILGGTISQLIAKAENQLAILENSAKETKNYISDMNYLTS